MNMSIRKFLAEEDGVTALEYALLAAIVAGVIVFFFGTKLSGFFSTIFTTLSTDVTTSTTAPTG